MDDERILYVPNEPVPGQQVGPRVVLADLRARGAVAEVGIVAFDPNGGDAEAHRLLAELSATARDLRPTIVLWEHPSALPLPRDDLRRFRAGLPDCVVVYREGDVYGLVRKRIPAGVRRLAGVADLVFVPGLGAYARRLSRAGAHQVAWAPSVVDASRFGTPWDGAPERRWDVVVIGSRHRSRRPLSALPGAGRRASLVEALDAELGPERFAVFGTGWDGLASARGPLSFDEQERASRRAWVTASWDHFDRTPYFFSNRLPISLLSGVAHLTNRHPGYDELFDDGEHLFLVDSVAEAVERIGSLLAGDRARLDAVGRLGQELARDRLTTERVYGRILAVAVAWRRDGTPPPAPGSWWRGGSPG